jgi:leucyl aminopeptidase
MKIEVINNHEYDETKQELVIVGVHDTLDGLAADYDELTDHKISMLIDSGDISTSIGSSFLLVSEHIPGERILLIGLGKKEKFNRKAFGKVAKAVASNIVDKKYDSIRFRIFSQLENHSLEFSEYVRDLTLTIREAEYSFDTFKSKQKQTYSPNTLSITMGNSDKIENLQQEQQVAEAVANGIKMTKDLGNTPSNVCTPTWLGEQARELEANDKGRTRVDVLNIASIRELGMNSFLSVAQGSAEEPKLIVVKYNGADDENEEPIALVGKGITFDSGGISIKPASGMNEMKYDMLGAATVLGVIKAIQQIGLKKNVVGVIPSCENMPSGTSVKPGDIVTSMSGITIENNNTDAEGRLILCDALTFTQRSEMFTKPTFVIDMATLTGAICVSLGSVHSGLFTKDDLLAENLVHAGSQTQDTLWEMPMDDAYDDMLKTNHADVANVGGRDGGSSSAACFLSRFIDEGTRWAHLDIAGTASIGGKDKHATGRPVHMLVQFLINMQ